MFGNNLAAAVIKGFGKVIWCSMLVIFFINAVTFALCYMRVYAVQNEAMFVTIENNYIPPDEHILLEQQMNDLTISGGNVLHNMRFTDGTNFTRVQYGADTVVGVRAEFVPLLIFLAPTELTAEGTGVAGIDRAGANTATILSDSEIEVKREQKRARLTIPINIERNVIGLKYYPDLEN
ncbi:hypothetical protein AGMMS49975_17390 [Clostridia bacterium]|nr:hypothetical protein AGMMS49975_17390 [Clostridia bacterium]GHU77999.1 hypothetical protein FACS1894188_12930 [Clostridia bacterium]